MNPDEKVTYFAETDFRNKKVKFGIKAKDRTRHMYVIGMTGMGKSTLLENMAIQDIQNGEGVAFIDPHGGTAEKLLNYIPEHRLKDVVYFAPFDTEYPISFNVLENVDPDKRYLVANGLMSAFKKIWVDAWSARMEYILNNILLALLEYPGSTLLGVNRMLTDKEFRKKVVDNVQDPSVKAFWTEEYAKYTDKFAAEAAPAIQNKVGQFTANPLIRNLIGQTKSSFDMRDIMDNKKILIMNLSKGKMGEGNANLIGSMLITKIYLASMSRADASPEQLRALPNFYFYVDEFQSFANESFADILSEARKYKLNLTIAHQYIEQMTDEVRAAVFGNVGTMIAFRVGSTDAETFEKEFAPFFTMEDIVSLGKQQIYLRLMIDGVGSQPFSATTLPPILPPDVSIFQRVISESRMHYSRPKEQVENEIKEWHKPIELSKEERDAIREKATEKKRFGEASVSATKNTWQGERSGTTKTDSRSQDRGSFSRRERPAEQVIEQKPNTSLKDALQKEMSNRASETKKETPRVVEEKIPEKISLSALAKDTKSPEHSSNKASLKDLLASVSTQSKVSEKPKPIEQTDIKASTSQASQAPQTQPIPEIPEEVLRKLLE